MKFLDVTDEVLAKLTPREEKVVKMLLIGHTSATLSSHFGVSLGRIDQITAKALRKVIFYNLNTEVKSIQTVATGEL